MKIQIFGLADDSIVDGPGIRFAVFTQGCPHVCSGCHNPGSHAAEGGTEYDTEALLEKIFANPLLDGVTFSGGEPFLQAKPLAEIARKVHSRGMNIVVYTGYTFEELIEQANEENGWLELLQEIDILIDGRFILQQRSIDLTFKGSANQRIIDVPASLARGKPVLSRYDDQNQKI